MCVEDVDSQLDSDLLEYEFHAEQSDSGTEDDHSQGHRVPLTSISGRSVNHDFALTVL